MIKFLLPLFIILFNFLVFPQVTAVPSFATEEDSIIVYFDATKGDAGLKGFTGDVYAHTGVITNLSTGPSDWEYVIAPWATNYPETKLTRDSTDHYHLVIGYPRIYYSNNHQNLGSIPPTEHIQKLAFVFRNADGSRTGRAAGGADIFLQLSEPGLNVSIIKPEKIPYFADLNDTITIEIASAHSNSLALFIDDILVAETDTTLLTHSIIADQYGKRKIKIIATGDSNETKIDSTYFIVNTPVSIEPVPNNLDYGINYISDNSVVLNLYAPQKDFVYVIGDFTNWEADPAYYMKRTPDQTKYWLQIDSLETGKEYIFQYLVDGELRIADPYSEKVSDGNDKFISSTVYPDLISYPEGKTTEIASVLQTAQEPYQWQVTDFERPKKTDLVIYELLIRDFIPEHSYEVLVDTLGYFKRLGVNAIELMPVMEFEGNESWGYNPSFHFAPDKYYGTKNDLKRFIDEAHKNGIAVILDIVLNHMYGQSPLVRLYWNSAQNRPAANNPWFNEVSPNPVFSFGYDFNHEKQEVKNYIDRVNKYWLTEYKVDGFRFDFTKGMTNTPGDGGNHDAARISILTRMANELRKVDSTAYIILEHFAPNSEETILSNNGMMLWGNLNHDYNEATMGYVGTSNFSGVSYKSKGWAEPNLVAYMESHDEERLMYKNLQFGNSSGSYNIRNLETALQRIKLAAVFYFTVPGPKMIWQFGELGYDVSIDFNGRVGNKPIRWYYYNEPARLKLYKTYAALTALKQYEAFESDSFALAAVGSVKRLNIVDETMDVYVIGNFNVTVSTANHSFSKTGYWYDYFTGDTISVSQPDGQVVLEPGEFHIYTTVKLPTPEEDIVTDVEENKNIITGEFHLEQNFPNPFNPSTEIIFRVPVTGNITIKIYDILGREIKTLINEEKSNGVYKIKWNGDNNWGAEVSSGIYFCRMETASYTMSRKMILLK
jgi:1,4-alpha-glucan branching enzyme